jgi:2-oxoglutarate ferredoxin oxidoreductase subunit beta
MSTQNTEAAAKLTKKDFASDQEVRWCPGCGDYSILSQIQKTLPELGIARENIVFVSGIGCSSRFPYYMETYGFHSIHGRAMTLASGIRTVNPDLSVWVITGDGDGLSIGGNHFLHTLRRNFDINVVLFNNRIYGLTKGQYSPTSEQGKVTKSSPDGAVDHPINPVRAAIAAEATFVGRGFDTDTKHLPALIERMARHKGVSFLEVFQNCNIFNDGAFEEFTDKKVRDDRLVYLEPGKPLIFGKERNKGIMLDGFSPKVVTIGENGISESDLLVWDAHDPTLAYLMSNLEFPDFPVPVGTFLEVSRPTYEDTLMDQIVRARKRVGGDGDLQAMISGSNTWTVS